MRLLQRTSFIGCREFSQHNLSVQGSQPRMTEGRCGDCHPIAPVWVRVWVAQHGEHVLQWRQPRYLTVLSIFVCPNSSWTARKLPVRR